MKSELRRRQRVLARGLTVAVLACTALVGCKNEDGGEIVAASESAALSARSARRQPPPAPPSGSGSRSQRDTAVRAARLRRARAAVSAGAAPPVKPVREVPAPKKGSCYARLVAGDAGEPKVRAAIEHGAQFLWKADVPFGGLVYLDSLYRRYGVPHFAFAAEDYDALLSSPSSLSSYLRAYRRLVLPGARAEPGDLGRTLHDSDRIMLPALHCDRHELPDDFATRLGKARDAGEYMLTHVGIALVWMDELGCEAPGGPAFEKDVSTRIARLAKPGDGMTDLEIESVAVLSYMGRADLIHPEAIETIVDGQSDDGGWLPSRDFEDGSHYHPTLLATWALLAQACPDQSAPFARRR